MSLRCLVLSVVLAGSLAHTAGCGAAPAATGSPTIDDQVQTALALPPDHRPLYLIPVGHPGQ